jgi:hypothetical protein
MRHAPHHEPILEIVEAIEVLEDQTEAAHERGLLEVPGELRIEFSDEDRVVVRERGEERGRDREVFLGAMAAATRSPVPFEGLLEEDPLAALDERSLGVRGVSRQLAAEEQERRGGPP